MKISSDRKRITMRCPDNGHAHFRFGELMEFLVGIFITFGWWCRVLAMPNLVPPILTGEHAVKYCGSIKKRARRFKRGKNFEPVPTIQITEYTTPEMVREAFRQGVRCIKVYPRYVTTHSQFGVVNYRKIYPALAVAEELGMIVMFHAEHPSYDVIGRLKERRFIKILDRIRKAFPKLRISVEHVSSAAMIRWLLKQPDWVGGSLTIHHMLLTVDDHQGYSKRSNGKGRLHDTLIKPCLKDPADLEAILAAAFSGNPKFWYGGDDAAHLRSVKEGLENACGDWNTIAALSLLISLFEKAGCLEKLEPFLSEHWARFFGYPLNKSTITFVRKDWYVKREYKVPKLNDSIVPFFALQKMEWQIAA